MELHAGKFLTFTLSKEEYGIPIQRVKEIIGIMEITQIPKTPKFIKGVINLRGKIIPIMDLRLKFGLSEKEYNDRTCIIVVEVNIEDSKRQIGIAVDAVSEVMNIHEEEMELPPEYGDHTSIEFLTGLGKVKGKVVLLLDIEKVLDNSEISLLKEMK